MSVDARSEIVVEKPRSTVASVMFDPKADPIWIVGVRKSFPQSSGLLVKGARFERSGTLVGREYSTFVTVVRDEPENFLEMTADEPFQMKIRYDLSDVEEGTLVKIRIQGFGEMDFQRSASSVEKAVLESIQADLKQLKKYVETELAED